MTATLHRLTLRQFDSVAAGGGDADALDALRRAQVSKRLLLLREVRLASALSGPEFGPAWSVLDAAMARRPEAVRTMLSRPFVDVWAGRVLREGAGRPDGQGPPGPIPGDRYLIGLSAAAGVLAGVPFELPLPLPLPPAGAGRGPLPATTGDRSRPTDSDAGNETLLLPGLGRIEGLGPGAHRLRYDASALLVEGADRAFRIEPGRREDHEHWSAYRTVPGVRDAEGLEVEVDDLDPHRSCFGLPATGRLDRDRAERAVALIRDALVLIDAELGQYRSTVRSCLRSVVPVSPPGDGSVSASNQSAFGAVAISPPADAAELALLLVHETQHAKLGALLDLVDLVDPSCTEMYHAPWRADPRPAGALLQGTYAHAAVADFWRVRRRHLRGAAARAAEFEYAFWRAQARRGAETLAGSGGLNPIGRSFVERLAEALGGWSEVADPEMQATASACITVTDVEWRLRNHRAPAARVAALAAAYRAGLPCPPVPEPEVLAGGAGDAAMSGSLVRAIRQRSVAAGTPATDTVPAGGGSRSVAEWDRRVRAGADDVTAWAMLALRLAEAGQGRAARALVRRPELVRGLVTAMAQPSTSDGPLVRGVAAGGSADAPVGGVAASAVASWLATGLTPDDGGPTAAP